VNERQLRSGGFDGCTLTRDRCQRFAAERSAEVAEKDQQQRRALLHLGQR
jgi:hypothetical protein